MIRILPTPVIIPRQECTTADCVQMKRWLILEYGYVSWHDGWGWRYWWPGDTWMLDSRVRFEEHDSLSKKDLL